MQKLNVTDMRQAMQADADRTAYPESLPALPEIPAARYYDPAFFKLEMAAMKRSWLFGIHGGEVPEPGCYKQWDQLGQPLVFVRDGEGKVRCYYNICRHRGSALVNDGSGKKRNISCPIHGWSYRLDGSLAGVPERRDFVEADLRQRSLMEVRCENLGELYFVNLDGNARPLLDDLGPVADAWGRYRPGSSHFIARLEMTVPANYKIVQDANLEVYHVNFVHPEIVAQFLNSSASAIHLFPHGHSIQHSQLRQAEWNESGIDLPRIGDVTDISRLANIAFHMFPNRIVAMNDWGYPLQSYWPIDERTTRVEVVWIAAAAASAEKQLLWNEVAATFMKVLEQDFQYVGAMQHSMESGALHGVLLGAQERCAYHFHEELDRRIGIDRIPAALRVRPVLGDCLAAA